MSTEVRSSGIADFAEAAIRAALEASQNKDLERQIEPLLRKWEGHPCCSFATAFRFRATDGRIDAYNPLAVQDSGDKRYRAFLQLINPEPHRLPVAAALPWSIFRDAARREDIEIFPPHVLVEGEKTTSPWRAATRHRITFLDEIKDAELNLFIEDPLTYTESLFLQDGVDAKTCSLRCFAVAPARIADHLRARLERSVSKKTCAIIYIMGTRRHFANVGSAFDYGLVVGLTEAAFGSASTPDTTIDALWCAWNLIAVPVYLQDRETRFSSLQAGRDVVHTIKTDLGRIVDPALDDICLKCEDGTLCRNPEEARSAVERIRSEVYSYPHFSSFVARRPCAANTEDCLRSEDIEREPYIPSAFLCDWLTQQLKEYRSAVDTGFKCPEDLSNGKNDAPRVYIKKRYLEMALSEAVDNMRRSGDQTKSCSIHAKTDGVMLNLTLQNHCKPGSVLSENAHTRKVRQGHGLNALRAFCQAMGGDLSDPIESDNVFTLSMTIGLEAFEAAYRRLNNGRGP